MKRAKENRKKHKKKVKRKVRKIYITAAAVMMAAATLVFCYYYIMYKTDFFNLEGYNVEGLNVYSRDYIISKTNMKIGQNIFEADLSKIESEIEKEVYVKNCKVSYLLPDKLNIKITEREEKYLIYSKENTIITDVAGYILDGNYQDNKLFPIECAKEINGTAGTYAVIPGIEDFNKLKSFIEYTDKMIETDRLEKLSISEDDFLVCMTKYGMYVKLKLDKEINYNYSFALSVAKERLSQGEEVKNCMLDFTKGDSPVFSYNTVQTKEGV